MSLALSAPLLLGVAGTALAGSEDDVHVRQSVTVSSWGHGGHYGKWGHEYWDDDYKWKHKGWKYEGRWDDKWDRWDDKWDRWDDKWDRWDDKWDHKGKWRHHW